LLAAAIDQTAAIQERWKITIDYNFVAEELHS
jgi:hypothetical protein